MQERDISKLRKNSSIYFKVGLIIAISAVIFAFNWTSYGEIDYAVDNEIIDIIELETIPPITKKQEKTPPPPVTKSKSFVIDIEPEPIIEPDPKPIIDPKPISLPVKTKIVKKKVVLPVKEDIIEDKIDEDEIVVIASEMPRFPGCEDMDASTKEKQQCAEKKLLGFIYKNINYPTMAREVGTEGTVVLRFIVEKDGSISGINAIRDIGAGCGKEAIRVIEKMPKWRPGQQGARTVRVQYTLPIKFQLN